MTTSKLPTFTEVVEEMERQGGPALPEERAMTAETGGWELVDANGERVIFSDARLAMLVGDDHGAGCQVRYYDGVCDDAAVLDEVSYEQWKQENADPIAEHRADLDAIDHLFDGK